MAKSNFSAGRVHRRQEAAYRVVPCSQCGARVGQRCMTATGRYISNKAGHKPRSEAAQREAAFGRLRGNVRPRFKQEEGS